MPSDNKSDDAKAAESIDRLREPTPNEETDAAINEELARLGFSIPGKPARIMFDGNPGEGKTQAFIDMAKSAGMAVKTIVCGPPDDMPEFEPSQAAIDELVRTLKEGLMVLVRDGLITERQADDRARNQATAVIGVFEIGLL